MDRISRDRALFIGLCALQDYVDQARQGPVEGTLQMRALLALLALHGERQTDAYRLFWHYVRKPYEREEMHRGPENYVRGTYSQTQWMGIARDLGFSGERARKVDEVLREKRLKQAVFL